jgi:hypothetical protein
VPCSRDREAICIAMPVLVHVGESLFLAPPGRSRHLPIARLHLHEPLMPALRSFRWVKMSVNSIQLTSIIDLDSYNYSVAASGTFYAGTRRIGCPPNLLASFSWMSAAEASGRHATSKRSMRSFSSRRINSFPMTVIPSHTMVKDRAMSWSDASVRLTWMLSIVSSSRRGLLRLPLSPRTARGRRD